MGEPWWDYFNSFFGVTVEIVLESTPPTFKSKVYEDGNYGLCSNFKHTDV
jgi:hypothetical protein